MVHSWEWYVALEVKLHTLSLSELDIAKQEYLDEFPEGDTSWAHEIETEDVS